MSQLLSTAVETEKYLRQNVVQVVPVKDDLYSAYIELVLVYIYLLPFSLQS